MIEQKETFITTQQHFSFRLKINILSYYQQQKQLPKYLKFLIKLRWNDEKWEIEWCFKYCYKRAVHKLRSLILWQSTKSNFDKKFESFHFLTDFIIYKKTAGSNLYKTWRFWRTSSKTEAKLQVLTFIYIMFMQ